MTELTQDEKKTRLIKYLDEKFLIFCSDLGRVANQAAFARYMGISSGSLSQYMNGDRLPDYRNKTKMAMALGPELYDVLGEQRETENDPRLMYLIQSWKEMTEKEKADLIIRLRKSRAINTE